MSRNKIIIKNTMFLATRTLVSLSVSFYTTRIVIQQLGAADYGLFNIIYGVVTFFTFVVTAMNDSVQRYIAIGVGSQKISVIRDAVKNSMFIFVISAFILAVCLILARGVIIHNILNIPKDSIENASVLYLVAVFSITILIIQTPLNAIVLAYEKMSFYAYMMIFEMVAKMSMALLLTLLEKDKVIVYSILLGSISFFNLLVYLCYCLICFKKSMFGGRIKFRVLKEISTFSFWNIFGNFSYMCRVQGVNIVINMFYAIAVNAAYAISITVLNAINTLTQSLITALRPQIFKSYGECDLKRYNHLVLFGSKYTFSILFLLSSPVILCADELLKIWLDIVPDYTVEFVRLVIVVAFIDSFSYSMIAGIQATGRIKTYQLVVSLIVLINLPLTFILFKAGNNVLSMFYPFIVTAIINQGLRLYFIYINAGFDYKKYFTVVIYPCLLAVCLSLVTDISIKKMLPFNSVIDVLIVCIFIFSFNTMIFYWVVVSKKEKKWLLETLKRKVK